jgi:SHS2 domain-containing protein
MAAGYRYVEHTADVEFIASGASMEELLSNALLAMFDTAADLKMLARQRSRQVRFRLKEKAGDAKDLLWSSLQDTLSAVILCRKSTAECAKLDVKGVSKYELDIVRKGKRLEASVVLDV